MSEAPTSVEKIPVHEDESLARRCDRKAIKNRIRPQVFLRATYPLDVSTDREALCDPWVKLRDEPSRTLVRLLVRDVARLDRARVEPTPPPLEHASIEIVLEGHDSRVPSRAQLSAEEWGTVVAVATELAELARDISDEDPR